MRSARATRDLPTAIVIALLLVAASQNTARAQVTYLNQIAGGPPNSPGYIPTPLIVGNVGPDGEFLIDGGFAANDGIIKAFAADGTYLRTLTNTIGKPLFSAIGPDGTYYVTSQLAQTVGVYSPNGVLENRLPAPGVQILATGVSASSNGSLFVAARTQIQDYSTTFDGTSYPLLGSFGSAGTGPGQFGASGIGAITLDGAGTNLYATDLSGNRVEVFTASGTYESSIGDASGPGHLNQPLGVSVGGSGLVYVTDQGPGIKVFSTAGTYLNTIATTFNGQVLQPVSVSVAPTGMVYTAGTTATGTVAMRLFDPASWSSGTNNFTNASVGPTSVAVGTGQLLGASLTLDSTKGLIVGQTTTVNNSGALTLSGGTLVTGSLVVDGSTSNATFLMTGGTLTANSITVGGGGVADFVGQPLTTTLGGTVSVSDANSQFKVEQGATVSAAALTNSGVVVVGANADFVVLNNSFNLGTTTLNGGELDVQGLYGNGPSALIQGSGTLSTTTGLSNSGSIQFTGQSSVMGVVSNLGNGLIEVSGQQSHTFFGGVINDGTFTIDPGSGTTFQGAYSGAQGITGTGTATFAGGLSPGGPVEMTFGGNVVLQHTNVTTMSLAGGTPGAGYDKLDVAGQLSLDGTLRIVLQSFTPQVGESFHLFTWGSEAGTFSQFILPALPTGEAWNMSHLYSQGTISVTITGDVNGDGIVNGQDLALISSNWLHKGTGQTGDANNDSVINAQDLALVSSNWLSAGTPVTDSTVAVPEPSTVTLALLAAMTIGLSNRRRMRR
jgi:hypothetical protein